MKYLGKPSIRTTFSTVTTNKPSYPHDLAANQEMYKSVFQSGYPSAVRSPQVLSDPPRTNHGVALNQAQPPN